MQTNFTPAQLADPATARSNVILRSCVHCGFCTATCPTYQLLGDELDSPRGRIYLIKDMLEAGRPADARTVKHIDRCLSCLACATTCPSGVDYMHLIDHARAHIEATYRRPLLDRVLRSVLAFVLPYPGRFRLALLGAKLARPFRHWLPDARLRAMIEMAPRQVPPVSRNDDPQVFATPGPRRMRVALLTGCAQKALNTDINDATIRLLTRFGCEVVVAEGAGCCGALTHHMGKVEASHGFAAANIGAWMRVAEQGLDAVVINTSGCGTTVKDYGQMFQGDPLAAAAKRIAGLAMDVTEVLDRLDLPQGAPSGPSPQGVTNGPSPQGVTNGPSPQGAPSGPSPQGAPSGPSPQGVPSGLSPQGALNRLSPQGAPNGPSPQGALNRLSPAGASIGLRVAYHAACSLQHGQQIRSLPKDLLRRAGFTVLEPADSHLCCGSAGTYNLLQPEISGQLRTRKVATLEVLRPDVIAAGNLGCMMQIGAGTDVPIVHLVELLDWATGGPKPRAMSTDQP